MPEVARVAAIYDVHGNLPALEAVLDDVRSCAVDHVVFGGDVFPGPMPREALARLLDLDVPTTFIHGNGDREVVARAMGKETDWFRRAPAERSEPVAWTAREIDADDVARVSAWPPTCRLEVDGLGLVLFCHATPRNDTEIFTRVTDEARLRPVFDGVDASVVVCGHTHMQFDRTVGDVRVVNAGSVGMPFGAPGAYWLQLGPGVDPRRTPYDLAAAADRVRATRYPQAEAFAAGIVAPRSEAATLEALSKAELS